MHCRVPIEETCGCISAELLCPYPPGVPVVFPGEYISQDTITILHAVKNLGGIVMGAGDECLHTIEVL